MGVHVCGQLDLLIWPLAMHLCFAAAATSNMQAQLCISFKHLYSNHYEYNHEFHLKV